jgi:hypothetical protein
LIAPAFALELVVELAMVWLTALVRVAPLASLAVSAEQLATERSESARKALFHSVYAT